jgi:hypothetical protein
MVLDTKLNVLSTCVSTPTAIPGALPSEEDAVEYGIHMIILNLRCPPPVYP